MFIVILIRLSIFNCVDQIFSSHLRLLRAELVLVAAPLSFKITVQTQASSLSTLSSIGMIQTLLVFPDYMVPISTRVLTSWQVRTLIAQSFVLSVIYIFIILVMHGDFLKPNNLTNDENFLTYDVMPIILNLFG